MSEIKRLRKLLYNWEDTSIEGLRDRSLIEIKIYEMKKKEQLKKKTGKRLGYDDVPVKDIS